MSRKRITSLLSAVMLITTLTACNSAAMQAIQQLQSEASSSAVSSESGGSSSASTSIPMPNLPQVSSSEVASSSQSSTASSSVPMSSETLIIDEPLEMFDVLIGDNGDSEWKDDRYLYETSWQFVLLDDVASMDYPDLAYSLYDLNMVVNNAGYDVALEFAQEIDANPDEYHNYAYEETVHVCRADSKIVSLLYETYYNAGGAHPSITQWSVNFDSLGGYVSLSSILNKPGEFTELLLKRLYEDNPDIEFGTDLTPYLQNAFENDGIYWTIDYQSLRVYFQPSEIAAAAAGSPQAVFWFDEYPDLLKQEYMRAPDSYAVELPISASVRHDLKAGDGEKDTICVAGYPGHDMAYNEFELWLNDGSYPLLTEEIDRAYAFLIHTEDDSGPRVYLYLIAYGFSDYPHLLIYDLGGEVPVQVDELYGVGLSTEWNEEFGSLIGLISDPDAFALDTHLELLGTMFGSRAYSVDPSTGLPVTPNQFYYIPAEPALTTLQPVEVVNAISGEKTTLPAGITVNVVNSDGEAEVEVMTDDYEFYRITIDTSGWPDTINGIPEDEVFDGIMYAG